ncbi:MAG: DUF2628 domain-containing protein [Clostridiales bacterium]|nr:DUF2628 domain-containing protein [Clostridiales bacterium]
MKYTGLECPACSKVFEDTDDMVVCPECGTPQHRECWNEHNCCVNAEKHSQGYVFKMPDVPEQAAPESDFGKNVRCPVCGTENPYGEPVCRNCGNRIYIAPQSPEAPFPPYANAGNPYPPYGESPNAGYAPQPGITEETIEEIPVSEVIRFVGPGSHKYIPRFLKSEKTGKKTGWNWGAFFFAQYWMFFRKMYKTALTALIIVFCLSFFTSALTASYSEQLAVYAEKMNVLAESASPDINAVISIYEEMLEFAAESWETYFLVGIEIGVHVIFGLFGNYLYKKEAVEKICAIRQASPDARTYFGMLTVKGGTSIAFVLIVLLVSNLAERLFAML